MDTVASRVSSIAAPSKSTEVGEFQGVATGVLLGLLSWSVVAMVVALLMR